MFDSAGWACSVALPSQAAAVPQSLAEIQPPKINISSELAQPPCWREAGSGFESCAALQHIICGMTNSFSFFLLPPLFSFSLFHKPQAQVEAKKEHEGAVQLLEVRSSGFPGNLQHHHLWTFQGICRHRGVFYLF